MKYGIEVEGRLKGLKTIFVDADFLRHNLDRVLETLENHKVSHLYISDRQNVLPYSFLSPLSGYLITLDVTEVTERPPSNITIILTLPHGYWDSIQNLRPTDQIKFHSHGRDVLCAPIQSFVPTSPSDFDGDIAI